MIVHQIDSSAVEELAYDGRTKDLYVTFRRPTPSGNGLRVDTYVYVNVPLFIVGAIFRSKSRGRALNRHVIGKTEFKKETAQVG